jgi:DNA-directed RNA polymerase specialized sigma24 family protein
MCGLTLAFREYSREMAERVLPRVPVPGRRQAVEDAVNQAFATLADLLRQRPLRLKRSIPSYLRRCAVNAAVTAVRRETSQANRRRGAAAVGAPCVCHVTAEGAESESLERFWRSLTPEEQTRFYREFVAEAARRLSYEQLAVMVLLVRGHPATEKLAELHRLVAAREPGVTIDAVQSRRDRARKTLLAILTELQARLRAGPGAGPQDAGGGQPERTEASRSGHAKADLQGVLERELLTHPSRDVTPASNDEEGHP